MATDRAKPVLMESCGDTGCCEDSGSELTDAHQAARDKAYAEREERRYKREDVSRDTMLRAELRLKLIDAAGLVLKGTSPPDQSVTDPKTEPVRNAAAQFLMHQFKDFLEPRQ